MEPEISLMHDGIKKYSIKDNDSYVKCGCGCVTFIKVDEDYACIHCEAVFDLRKKCISCQELIELEDVDFFDIDKCGAYCELCFNRLPEELKINQ